MSSLNSMSHETFRLPIFEMRRGQPQEFLSFVSIIDSSTLPEDCMGGQLY